jgi:5-methylcytosine-specific restriction protein A
MAGKLCPVCAAANCTVHKQTRRRRASPSKKGYDRKWARASREYLKTHIYCEAAGCWNRATEVHHRDGLGPNET